MIEFQLTVFVYMCSYCTRVHNAAHDCVRHEQEEHANNQLFTTPVVDNIDPIEPTVSTSTTDDSTSIKENIFNFRPSTDPPFTIADDDIKPEMTINQEDDSALQRTTSSMQIEEIPVINENDFNVVLRHGTKCDAPITSSNKVAKQDNASSGNEKKNKVVDNGTCTICGKCFMRDLKRHMLIHSDERPLKCAKCPRRFCQNANRMNHERRVHNYHRVRKSDPKNSRRWRMTAERR